MFAVSGEKQHWERTNVAEFRCLAGVLAFDDSRLITCAEFLAL